MHIAHGTKILLRIDVHRLLWDRCFANGLRQTDNNIIIIIIVFNMTSDKTQMKLQHKV